MVAEWKSLILEGLCLYFGGTIEIYHVKCIVKNIIVLLFTVVFNLQTPEMISNSAKISTFVFLFFFSFF